MFRNIEIVEMVIPPADPNPARKRREGQQVSRPRLPREKERARREEIIRRYNGGNGEGLPALSEAFSISRQRVHQIVNGRKGRA